MPSEKNVKKELKNYNGLELEFDFEMVRDRDIDNLKESILLSGHRRSKRSLRRSCFVPLLLNKSK